MASIRYKWGADWSSPVPNGNLRTRWGGDWFVPTTVYGKTGQNLGDRVIEAPYAGDWADTGYRGYPATPANLWVNGWTYDAISLGWSGGGGGAPVAAWHLVQTNEAGTSINQVETTQMPWGNFGMSWDTNYTFHVRAKSAAGLYSPFYGPLRVHCGHPVQYQYGWVQRHRNWNELSDIGTPSWSWGYRDNLCRVNVGGDILVDGIYWNIYCHRSSAIRFGNRWAEIFLNEGYWMTPDWYGASAVRWDYPYYWGNGGGTGVICRGAGWSSTAHDNGYPRIYGNFTVYGQQYYDNYEVVNTIGEQGNYTY